MKRIAYILAALIHNCSVGAQRSRWVSISIEFQLKLIERERVHGDACWYLPKQIRGIRAESPSQGLFNALSVRDHHEFEQFKDFLIDDLTKFVTWYFLREGEQPKDSPLLPQYLPVFKTK